jgi:hypothetical protein
MMTEGRSEKVRTLKSYNVAEGNVDDGTLHPKCLAAFALRVPWDWFEPFEPFNTSTF